MIQHPASLPSFDFDAFVTAFDIERQARGLSWFEFADNLVGPVVGAHRAADG